MLDKLCLVMDIDETMVHYIEDAERYVRDRLSSHFTKDVNIFSSDESDVLLHRPGLGEFFEYIKGYSPDNVFRSVSSHDDSSLESSPVIKPLSNKSITIGIWTYGTRRYADKVAELLKQRYGVNFEFIYSREDMQEGMEEKELEFILKHHGQELGLKKENIYLVDNCPSNIYHNKNLKNGILVTSFIGSNIDRRDTMFTQLISVCEELLRTTHVSKRYINKFTLNGVPTDIISIGKNGIKAWDSDDSCMLYIRDEFENYGGSFGSIGRKTAKKHRRHTRKQNKRRIYKTGRRNSI